MSDELSLSLVPPATTASCTGRRGLVNHGSTSYLNVLIQALSQVPELNKAVLAYKLAPSSDAQKDIAFQLREILVELGRPDVGAVSVLPLTHSFGWGPSDLKVEQDAQELLLVLFERLQKFNPNLQAVVEGQLLHVLQGRDPADCPHSISRPEPFLSLELGIRNTLEESFEALCENDELVGSNSYFCDQCSTKRDTLKGLCLGVLPPVLWLSLKRFEIDYETFQRVTIHRRMEFPMQLDLTTFLDPARRRMPVELTQARQQAALRLLRGLLAGYQKALHSNLENLVLDYVGLSIVYTLWGVVAHNGIAESGHYDALFRQEKGNDSWLRFADESVTEAGTEEVQRLFGDGESIVSAYMLVYRQANKDFIDLLDAVLQT